MCSNPNHFSRKLEHFPLGNVYGLVQLMVSEDVNTLYKKIVTFNEEEKSIFLPSFLKGALPGYAPGLTRKH